MRIGIFGRSRNREVAVLSEALRQRGARPIVIGFHGYPHLHTLTWSEAIRFDDIAVPTPIELEHLNAVHLRPAVYGPMDDVSASRATHATVASHHRRQVERLALQLALSRHLARRVPVINPPRRVSLSSAEGVSARASG